MYSDTVSIFVTPLKVQHQDYRFAKIVAEFKYTTPTPYDAEKLLRKLAHDPGIKEIMVE
jgi:hypothetical protein